MFFKKRVEKEEKPQLEKRPEHVAFIMDGNGRWAKKRGLPRLAGHKAGVETLRQVIETSHELGIKHITLYAFSTENWKRPEEEVSGLMDLLIHYFHKEIEALHKNDVVIHLIGDLSPVEERVRQTIEEAMKKTKNNKGLQVHIAFNYGSRDEMIRAMKKMTSNQVAVEDIDEGLFSSYLDTAGIPDPELMIRTSGEQRLSNFLLWQLAYAEFYFTDKYWPDFDREAYLEALDTYARRERRFGALEETS